MKTTNVRSRPDTTRGQRNAALSGLVGSALEYYDFALYAQAAALGVPAVFFAAQDDSASIIASLSTYAVGYVARPIGAVVLGSWGDRRGRKNVLVFAMVVMGLSTFAVGLLPTYAQIGIWAPILLVTLRLVQGFAVAGELGGASAMIIEQAAPARRGWLASFSLQGTQIGSILATAVMLPLAATIGDDAFLAWGWRIPFLLSALVVFAGYAIRRGVDESPVFAREAQANRIARAPFVDLVRSFPTAVVRCILMTFTNALGLVALTFGVAYGTQPGYGIGFTTSQFLLITLVTNLAAAATIPLFGSLSDRFGRRRFMTLGGFFGGLSTFGYLWAISQRNLALVILTILILHAVFYQMWNATFATFFQEQFPTRMRVTGFAVSQNVGLMIASFFPSVFVIVAPPGSGAVPVVVGAISLGLCLVAVVATMLTRETRGMSLTELDAR
jgi:MFS family permease